jgi:hypothetical protein
VAGERALRSFSNREAESHFRSALRIIGKLPHSRTRDEHELQATQGLHIAISAIKGVGFEELAAILDRTGRLCRLLARDAELADTLRINALHHTYVGDMRRAYDFAAESVSIAVRTNDPAQLALSRGILGTVYYWMGRTAESCTEAQQAVDFDLPNILRSTM